MRSAWCLTVVLLFSLGLAGPGQAAPDPLVISDFETETDFSRWLPAGMINNCPDPCTHTPATLTRVTEHPTSGSYACRIDAPGPPAAGVGMTLVEYITNDWSDYSSLYLDVYNPHPFPLVLDVALGDVTYGDAWEYISTSHHLLALGLNHVKVDLRELHRDFAAGEVDRTQIGYLALFLPHVPGDTTVYVDHLRLDTEPDDPFADAVRNIWKFDFGTPTSFRWPDFLRVTDTDTYPVDVSAKPYGWTNGTDREAVDLGGPDGLTRDCVRSPHGCCRRADTAQLDFRLDIPNGDYRVYLIARSGDNFNWPSLGWRVTAEGAVKLSASMDSATFYTTDYFYRGMDEDYPLSRSAWEVFEEPNLPAWTFPVTVADGRLDLSFLGPWLYALIVYPDTPAMNAEMDSRLADLTAARRAQFETNYYLQPPQDLTFSATPEEIARGFAAWPVAAMDPVSPDTLPPDVRPTLALSAAGVPGERLAAPFAIRALADQASLEVAVSDLTDGHGHTLPHAQIRPQYVRYFPLPDSGAADPPFAYGVLHWTPEMLQHDFPIPLTAQVSKEVWLTITVPSTAVSGTYTGTVTITASSGAAVAPLTLEVWPLRLDTADDQSYGFYYYWPYDHYDFRQFADQGYPASEAMMRLEFADLKAHGYNGVSFPEPICTNINSVTGHIGALDFTPLTRTADAMRAVGFGGRWKGQSETIYVARDIRRNSSVTEFDSNFNAAFRDYLTRFLAWQDSPQGVPLVSWLVDEPREDADPWWNSRVFADTMQYAALAHQVPGVTTTVTVGEDRYWIPNGYVDYTPLAAAFDVTQTSPRVQCEGLMQAARAPGKLLWLYNGYFNREDDGRLIYGFYNYAHGDGVWNWIYGSMYPQSFDALPYSPYKNAYDFTYPSPTGPVPTLRFEQGSLGIWDFRYAATLDRVAQQARSLGTPEATAWADQADALLQTIKDDLPEYPIATDPYNSFFCYQPVPLRSVVLGPGWHTAEQAKLDLYRRQIAELLLAGQATLHTLAVTAAAPDPNPVASGDTAALHATAFDAFADGVAAWSWSDGGAGGSFSPSALVPDPTYTAPANQGVTDLTVTLTVTATCDGGVPLSASDSVVLTVRPFVGATAVSGNTLPSALLWEASQSGLLTYRNLDTAAWDPTDGYQLLPTADSLLRWGQTALPLSGSVAPGGSATFALTLTAPPVTTLRYDLGATPTALPVTAALPCVWNLARGDVPLTGGHLSQDIVISRFPDIQPGASGAWARAQIEECAGRLPHIVGGYPNGTYQPALTVTRDQMAVFMQRALMLPLGHYAGEFSDVISPFWAESQIQSCVDASIVGGYSDGTYRPAALVNRDAMAVFVARGLAGGESGVPSGPALATFPDVPTGYWAFKHIEYAVAKHVVAGYSDRTYRPTVPVARDQMAVFVYRATVQPTGAVVVLAGPAVTAVDPRTGGACGWASLASGPSTDPGYAYLAFDAVRLDESLAHGGTWEVKLELRRAASPTAPAVGAYTTTLFADPSELAAATATALSTGEPHFALAWDLPAGLAPDSYLLVVSVEDPTGELREVARRPAFTITP